MNAVVVWVVSLLTSLLSSFHTCDRLNCIHVQGSDAWKEKEVYEQTANSYRALLSAPGYLVRAEKGSRLSPNDAAFLIKLSVMQMNGVFDDARSPYPGVISDRVTCDRSFKPKAQSLQNGVLSITYYVVSLNDRLQYGSCIDTDLPYKSYSVYFYCSREGAMYHLDFITDRKDSDDAGMLALVRSVSCK